MKDYLLEIFNALTYGLVFLQNNEIFQYIELSLSIATSCVLIAYRIWKWHKKASADGKIDKEEVKEMIDIIIDGKEEIADTIDDAKKGGNNG